PSESIQARLVLKKSGQQILCGVIPIDSHRAIATIDTRSIMTGSSNRPPIVDLRRQGIQSL
ncbi:MAG TPA: hypothetical protein V6D20_00910, partial [Candidatus Obscuribacterales bacterium]